MLRHNFNWIHESHATIYFYIFYLCCNSFPWDHICHKNQPKCRVNYTIHSFYRFDYFFCKMLASTQVIWEYLGNSLPNLAPSSLKKNAVGRLSRSPRYFPLPSIPTSFIIGNFKGTPCITSPDLRSMYHGITIVVFLSLFMRPWKNIRGIFAMARWF